MLTRRDCKRRKFQLRHLQCLGCSKCSASPGCGPGFWDDVFSLTIGHGGQACQNVVQLSVGLDAVPPATFDNRVDDRTAFTGIGITEK